MGFVVPWPIEAVVSGFLKYLADKALWLVALVVAAAPRRVWPSLEPHVPLHSAAPAAGILTFGAGFAVGIPGFFEFASRQAAANNAWMLRQLASAGADTSSPMVPLGMSLLTLFVFLFFTPTGLAALYLVTSGALRGISAWFDDPHGDPLLSGLHWAATTLLRRNRDERQRLARERREGPAAPDVLRTGAWAGLTGVDYLVLASRRKPEWNAGAIILTSGDWYRLGAPFDLETPSGLRTAYPITRMDAVEVVRRGIRYELPPLGGKSDVPS